MITTDLDRYEFTQASSENFKVFRSAGTDIPVKNATHINVYVTTTGDFTADFANNELDDTAHGHANANELTFTNSGGALPTGLLTNTLYYVVNTDTNDFQVSLTSGGTPVTFTDAGTGTHTWSKVTKKVLNTDYTVSLSGTTATVTWESGKRPADGDKVLFLRNVPFQQDTDLKNNSLFEAESVETQLDLIVNMTQQLKNTTARNLRFSDLLVATDAEATAATLTATKDGRKNKSLKFDSIGNLGVSSIDVDKAEDYVLESKSYATETGAVVNTYDGGQASTTSDYSSKEWATGTTATSAKDYATKVDGAVTGTDYSAKAWSVGGTGVTDTASRGAAKEWAIENSGTVDGTSYSAKEYAQGTQASTGGSAKSWAQDTDQVNGAGTNDRSAKAWSQGASMTGATLGGSAKDWAQLAEDSQVNGSEYSAKHYSAKSSASATAAAASEVAARNSANSVTNILDNFGDKYLGTMSSSDTASTATITGAKWVKGGSQITNVTQASGTIEEGQVLTVTDGSATGWPTTTTVRIIDYNSGTSTITINQVFTDAQTSGEGLTGTGYGVYGAYDASKEGPSKDNDNGNLVDGALYFDTTNSVNSMRVYDLGNTKWVKATSSGTVSINEFKFTATANQTTFTGSADSGGTLSYSTSNLIVTLNGVVMENGADYTANNGTSIVLSSGAAVNDELNVIAFKSFETSDMVSASSGGTFNANVSFGDNNITNVGDISLDTISSDAGTSIGVTLGTDAGDDFNVGSGKLLVEGDTGLVSIGTGGDFETSTTGKIKQKGAFMQHSTHQSWVLGG